MGVYFLLSHDGKYVKIGKSKHPRKRIRQIRQMNSHELTALLVVPGYTSVESWFHFRFSHLRWHDEWFLYEGALVEMVALLKSGSRTIDDMCPGRLNEDLSNTI